MHNSAGCQIFSINIHTQHNKISSMRHLSREFNGIMAGTWDPNIFVCERWCPQSGFNQEGLSRCVLKFCVPGRGLAQLDTIMAQRAKTKDRWVIFFAGDKFVWMNNNIYHVWAYVINLFTLLVVGWNVRIG